MSPCRTRSRQGRALPRGACAVLALCILTGLAAPAARAEPVPAEPVPAVQRLPRYAALLQRPLPERLLPADDAVLDRALATNRSYGDDVRPQAADPADPLARVAREVLAGLPEPVTRLAERTLAAVYLVRGDVGTATTEGVQDTAGRWSHGYIVLNLSALARDANAWATWKEGSAFRPSPGYALRLTIEPPQSDDRAGALRFILLHELGHVLGLALGVHGYWDDPAPEPPPLTRRSAFVALSWVYRPAEGSQPAAMRSRDAARFPRLSQLAFYRFDKAPTPLADAPQVYAELAQTNLPSLYATQGLFDDFAETFAIAVHTRLLGRPYRVEVLRDGQPVQHYTSCLVAGTCPAKLAQIEALLRGDGAAARAPAPAAPTPGDPGGAAPADPMRGWGGLPPGPPGPGFTPGPPGLGLAPGPSGPGFTPGPPGPGLAPNPPGPGLAGG